MNIKNISFKISTGSEEDFLILKNLHKSAMFKSVNESIGQWDEEIQKTILEQNFKENFKTLNFIMLNNQMIGTINSRIKEYEDGVYHFIEQLYFLPEFQGKGFGSYFLNLKINQQVKDTRLSFLKKDIKAQSFYLKNGFNEYQEDEYQKYMQISKK